MIAPGIHTDITAEQYHADPCDGPSLSSSIGKILIDQSPAHARVAHPRLNPPDPDAAERNPSRPMEIGTAAHKMTLGKGREVVPIDAENYLKKDAKEVRAAAYAAGHAPILAGDLVQASAAADAFKATIGNNRDLAWAFGDGGESEAVVIWREGNIWCRAMTDRQRIEGERAVLVDLKFTAESANPASVSRRIYQMGYDFSAAFYRRGLAFVAPQARKFTFLLATTETEPPYATSLVTLDEASWVLAEKRIRAAVTLWDRCITRNEWPSYPGAVATAELPAWMESAWLEREMNNELLASLPRTAAHLSDIHQRGGKDLSGAC